MTMVNMHEAKSQLSKLIEQATSGEEVIIARAGKPVVKLLPIEKKKRVLGILKGKLPDLPADFDEVTPEYLAMWGLGEEARQASVEK